jgi:hypothetical protein
MNRVEFEGTFTGSGLTPFFNTHACLLQFLVARG